MLSLPSPSFIPAYIQPVPCCCTSAPGSQPPPSSQGERCPGTPRTPRGITIISFRARNAVARLCTRKEFLQQGRGSTKHFVTLERQGCPVLTAAACSYLLPPLLSCCVCVTTAAQNVLPHVSNQNQRQRYSHAPCSLHPSCPSPAEGNTLLDGTAISRQAQLPNLCFQTTAPFTPSLC